ncbi:filament integrity protein FraC [Thermocoleostomius sinensis]|jgi:hypothetical protein|uniref:Filament integrity protein fraC n=1 Tax=Thermocoleostomius sinensis A174 TaxID=2016057 RepID=A0A9E8ZFM2_9CYAN|nr:filament integrity protein FraC [Thermocoleostomius sinensis]WAL62500.1 hypothetical protein OXH18_11055 [Thermocoleostomius sinensis A174]
MVSNVLPLRTVLYQSVFLLIAIAIEATVLYRLLDPPPTPKQSIQYATSINLLCTVVGWLFFFVFYGIATALPSAWTTRFETNLVQFIFFDRWTSETATTLILLSLIMFFASFAIKQSGLIGLRWLLEAGSKKEDKKTAEELAETPIKTNPSPRRVIQDMRYVEPPEKVPSERLSRRAQARAVLSANAWSFSAISALLILRFAFQSTLNLL